MPLDFEKMFEGLSETEARKKVEKLRPSLAKCIPYCYATVPAKAGPVPSAATIGIKQDGSPIAKRDDKG